MGPPTRPGHNMAKIDKFLLQMVNKGATVLRMDPGECPIVEVAGGHRIALSSQSLLGTVLDGVAGEILPPEWRNDFDRGEKVNFDYALDGVRYQVLVCRTSLGTRIAAARFSGASAQGVRAVAESDGALDGLVERLLSEGGSDLYLTADEPPLMRVAGGVESVEDFGPVTARRIQDTAQAWAPARAWEAFTAGQDVEFARQDPAMPCRLRVSLFHDHAGPGLAVRAVPQEVPDPATLGLPETVRRLAGLNKGLVLLTGPMGSGKSTTLASLLTLANQGRPAFIVTVQDSVEFDFPDGSCIIRQREVGGDRTRHHQAIRSAMKQGPDILAAGAIRDAETLDLCLQAVQTGRVVIATHISARREETLASLAGLFPPDQRRRVLARIADCLTAIVGHTLLPRVGGGQVVAFETFFNNPGIASLIRTDRLSQLQDAVRQSRYGQVTHEEALVALVEENKVAPMEAYLRCQDRGAFISACHRSEIDFDPRGAGLTVTEI